MFLEHYINNSECLESINTRGMNRSPKPKCQSSTSFFSARLNSSTFLIIEDDNYGEEPHIYVKIYPGVIIISDTGCNTPRQKGLDITSLRPYLETWPVPGNNNEPLNPGGKKAYIILCSHAHYDHILGIEQFLDTNPVIVASGNNKAFITADLPTTSLCKYLDIRTPKYTVSHWARQAEFLSLPEYPFLRVQFMQIPGHTPDSLAWYDIDEHHLYVGDIFYEAKRSDAVPGISANPGKTQGIADSLVPIIFPEQGNWIHYMASLELLLSFTRHQNKTLERQWALKSDGDGCISSAPKVKLGAGHVTAAADAESMILEVQDFFWAIIDGHSKLVSSEIKRGVVFDYYVQKEYKYSSSGPRYLVEEARKHFGIL